MGRQNILYNTENLWIHRNTSDCGIYSRRHAEKQTNVAFIINYYWENSIVVTFQSSKSFLRSRILWIGWFVYLVQFLCLAWIQSCFECFEKHFSIITMHIIDLLSLLEFLIFHWFSCMQCLNDRHVFDTQILSFILKYIINEKWIKWLMSPYSCLYSWF